MNIHEDHQAAQAESLIPVTNKPLGEQRRAVLRQQLMVLLGNIGVISLGMGLGLPTVTKRQLTNTNEAIYLTESQFTWFASLNTLSCPLGGLLSGAILDFIGRKKTLYVLNFLCLSAWALMVTAQEQDASSVYIQLLVSRFIMGISIGLASAPVGVYAAEISMPKTRGHLILGTSIATAVGITLIYLLGVFIHDDWHLIAFICCVFQIIAFICVLPMPESPNWLISKGRLDEAKKSLNYFRGLEKKSIITHPEVMAEYNLLQKTIQLGAGEKKPSLLDCIRLPEVYKPLLILMGLFAFQQLTGIFVFVVYAVQIAKEVNCGVILDPVMCAVLLGMARLLITCPMGVILQWLGRRKAGMISSAGVFLCMFLLPAYSLFEHLTFIPYMKVLTMVVFMMMSTIGLYTLPFIMISELFPQKVRGPAAGLTVAVGLFISFICIKTFPSLEAAFGINIVLMGFGTMAFLAFGFIYFFLPETRGRTLLEIEEEFRGKTTIPYNMTMQAV